MKLSGHPAVRIAIPAMSVALAVVGAAATSRALTGRPSETPPAKVLAVPASEVRSITVESGAHRVSLDRSTDGTWTGGAGASPETVSLMPDVEGRLFPLQGYRSLAADTAGPEYGLVAPEITFRVTDTGGAEQTVLLGATTFTSGGVYARRSAEAARLYLVPRRMMDDLRSLLTGKRIDTPNDLPEKLKENTPKHDPTSWWLRQADAGGAR